MTATSIPAQTAGGINYWLPNAPYLSATVDNAPPDSDIIRLTGGTATGTQTLSFSSAVTNPILAVLSLGQAAIPVTYNFDADFTLLSSGTGFWGGNAAALTRSAPMVLRGTEGHGAIQFLGSFTSISWTIPTAESWHGFQVGLPEQAPPPIPEPSTIATAVTGFGLIAMRFFLRRRGNKGIRLFEKV